MHDLFLFFRERIEIAIRSREQGAVGVLVLGVIIGVLLVVFGIIKFVIPGD